MMREIGIVKWFGGYNTKKCKENNYGFIQTADYTEIYVNKKDLVNTTIKKNDLVTFEIEYISNKPNKAINVKEIATDNDFLEKLNISGHLLNILKNVLFPQLVSIVSLANKIADVNKDTEEEFNNQLTKFITANSHLSCFSDIINELLKNKAAKLCQYIKNIEYIKKLNYENQKEYYFYLFMYEKDVVKKKTILNNCNYSALNNIYNDLLKNDKQLFCQYAECMPINMIFDYYTTYPDIIELDHSFLYKLFEIIHNNKNSVMADRKKLFDKLPDNVKIDFYIYEIKKYNYDYEDEIISLLNMNKHMSWFNGYMEKANDHIKFKMYKNQLNSHNDKVTKTKMINLLLGNQDADWFDYKLYYICSDKNTEFINRLDVDRKKELCKIFFDDDSVSDIIKEQYFKTLEEDIQILITYLYLKKGKIYNLNIKKDDFNISDRIYLIYLLIENAQVSESEKRKVIQDFVRLLNERIWNEDKKTLNEKNFLQGIKMDYILPKCIYDFNFYCEGKHWTIKETNTDTLFCPRGKKISGSKRCDDGYKKHYLSNKEIEDWTIKEVLKLSNFFDDGIIRAMNTNKKDFVAKMSGMYNRLNELRDKLRCRKCNEFMAFNMKYSKNFFAVYATTVASCKNQDEEGHDTSVYLSHCFNCGNNIDSRECKKIKGEKYYICPDCGAHDTEKNVCPKCLSEDVQNRNGSPYYVCTKCGHEWDVSLRR